MNDDNLPTERVVVNFPDEMKVEAPETDALIDSLTQAFDSYSVMLQESTGEILDALQTLKYLPEMVGEFQKEVAGQFTNLFKHQIESQIFSRHANILAIQKKISALESHQDEKVKQLAQDKSRIARRYIQLLEKLGEECRARIRRLDSHAFEIVEKRYPKEIQEKFSFESMPAVEFLAAHAHETAEARALCLDEGLERARASLQNFLDQRQDFYEELDAFVASGDFSPGWYEIPFLVVETEDTATGEISLNVVLDPAIADGLEVSGDLVERLRSVATEQALTYKRVPVRAEDRVTLADMMCASFEVPEEERARFEAEEIEMLTPMEVKQ